METQQSPQQLKEKLFVLIKKYAYKEGRVVLSSGKIGNYYIDARVVTLSAEGAYLTASIILELIKDKDISAIGGPTLGADPFLGAISALSYLNKKPLDTLLSERRLKNTV